MIEVINVSSRGQIVIPEKMREQLKIKKGSRLVLIERNGDILIRREEQFEKELDEEKRENIGWMMLAEKSLKTVWDNPQDEGVWKKYI